MIEKSLTIILIGLLVGIASAEWLEGSPDYSEIRSYFSDPIFYTNPSESQLSSARTPYYHYFGEGLFKEPLRLGEGAVRKEREMRETYPSPLQSEFRNRSLAGMEWGEFHKNWTATLNLAKHNSSFKVFAGGSWSRV